MRALLALIFFIPFLTFSQIEGHINDYQFHQVELLSAKDILTNSFEVIELDTIQMDGSFQFHYSPESAGLYFLRIGNKYVNLILESDVAYTVDLQAPKFKQVNSEQIAVNSFEADGKKQTYLHEVAIDIDNKLGQFVIEISEIKNDSVKKARVDSFQTLITSNYSNYINQYEWLKTEVENRFDLIESTLSSKALDSVFYKNFDPKSGSYFQIFEAYIKPKMEKWILENQDSLIEALPDSNSIQVIINELEIEFNITTNNELIEYVLLYELYTKPFLKNDKLKRVELIQELKQYSNSPIIQFASKKAIFNLTKLMEKTKAPSITLYNKNDNSIELEKLKGRFVYIQFWSLDNTSSLLDLMLIESMQKKYGRDISFVSINTDGDHERLKKYLAQHKYNWLIGYVKNTDELKFDYNIQTTPLYYLLDAENNLYKSPADRPDRMYKLFDKIKAAEVSSYKPYEIIQTYSEDE